MKRRFTRVARHLFLPILVVLSCSCSGRHPAPPPVGSPASAPASEASAYWPTTGWRRTTPASQGMDGALLDAAREEASREGLALHGLLVVRHGFIVNEAYFPPYAPETTHELYSCTKSFLSALTGIAIQRGYLHGVTDPVLGFFPDRRFRHPDPRKSAITVDNLLTMSSGLAWAETDATYRELYAMSRDWVAYVLDQPMEADPGSRFLYSSGNSHVLSAIIQKRSATGTYEFAREALFRPLGIRDPDWGRDPMGIPIGGWGLQLAPRDMAKLGYLYLHDGNWDGVPVVPSSWVRDSTRVRVQGPGEKLGYGYQWWVDASVPMFAALGRFGQGIFVVPSRDLVVVFTAQIDSNEPELDLIRRFILPACQEARPQPSGTGGPKSPRS
jgi:CubicO group peptidase (beta-lactamase class C family)